MWWLALLYMATKLVGGYMGKDPTFALKAHTKAQTLSSQSRIAKFQSFFSNSQLYSENHSSISCVAAATQRPNSSKKLYSFLSYLFDYKNVTFFKPMCWNLLSDQLYNNTNNLTDRFYDRFSFCYKLLQNLKVFIYFPWKLKLKSWVRLFI